jgi:hypothetical protein
VPLLALDQLAGIEAVRINAGPLFRRFSRSDIQDRDGGLLLLATLFGKSPFLQKLFADSAYRLGRCRWMASSSGRRSGVKEQSSTAPSP